MLFLCDRSSFMHNLSLHTACSRSWELSYAHTKIYVNRYFVSLLGDFILFPYVQNAINWWNFLNNGNAWKSAKLWSLIPVAVWGMKWGELLLQEEMLEFQVSRSFTHKAGARSPNSQRITTQRNIVLNSSCNRLMVGTSLLISNISVSSFNFRFTLSL